MSNAGIAKLARPHPRIAEADLVWREEAACRNHPFPDVFFSDAHDVRRYIIREWCSECPVRNECLREALDNDQQWGIWGGLSVRERNKLLRRT
jgi:WhiB family redox-sensing transcriptional regulator